jgi:hypothetical protein
MALSSEPPTNIAPSCTPSRPATLTGHGLGMATFLIGVDDFFQIELERDRPAPPAYLT